MSTAASQIIETSANRFYQVFETGNPALAHVWNGYEVRKLRGQFVLSAAGERAHRAGRPELIRKAAARVVEA